jgi:hypothetical protein
MRNLLGLGSLLGVAMMCGVTPAHADVRGVVRFGVLPLELEASSDTPLFGDDVDDAVAKYNQAAAAYDQRHGGTTERIDAGDLGVDETLVTFAPGLELGGGLYFMRLEGLIGIGDELRSYGIGLYPVNLQARFAPKLVGYVSAGGTASWLDRDGSDGIGGLVSARAAGGVRISERVSVEAGYSAFALGGVVDLEAIDNYDPRMATPPSPRSVVIAGDASGLVDLSVGVVF